MPQHLRSGGGGWREHRRQQHEAPHLATEGQRCLERDRPAHRGSGEEERQLRVRLLRGLDEEERVGLQLLGAVDEAALAAAQAVSGKVGRAHGESATGECLRGHAHTSAKFSANATRWGGNKLTWPEYTQPHNPTTPQPQNPRTPQFHSPPQPHVVQ